MQNVKTKNGLRVRPSYERLMDAVIEDDIIKPKKPINVFDANWLMSTHAMTQLRKDALLDIQNLEIKKQQQVLLEMKAKEISMETGTDIREAREEVKPKKDTVKYYDISDGGRTNQAMDAAYYEMELEDAERKRKEGEKTSEAIKKVKADLEGTIPNTLAYQLALAKSTSVPMDEEELDPQPRGKGRPLHPKGTKKLKLQRKQVRKGEKRQKKKNL